jgi:DNA repair exonuclease SbcCD ATPase subunit
MQPIRRLKQSATSSTKTETEKRALSAQNDKLRSLEARLAELRRELEAQRIENSTLRTIQRREEKAIKKYEEKEYDIHRIVKDYTHEIDHIKDVLTNEREVKMKLERRIQIREEKLRDQTKRLKEYEKIVQEKKLDERYELHEKLSTTDKRLKEVQEKLDHQVN